MLMAMANDRPPGQTFQRAPLTLRLTGSIISEQRLAFIEVIRNGLPDKLIVAQNRPTPEGACETQLKGDVTFDASGWMALRCWEDRPGGRVRFAHTAPWHVRIAGKPLRRGRRRRRSSSSA